MLITLVVLYTIFVMCTLYCAWKIWDYACYYEDGALKFNMRVMVPMYIICFDIILGVILLFGYNYFMGA